MNRHLNTTNALLDWVLQRGRHLLTVRVSPKGNGYQVSVLSPEQSARVFNQYCDAGPSALRVHAALVAGFRDAGWKSVAYR